MSNLTTNGHSEETCPTCPRTRTTNPTNEHREQAREIVLRVFRLRANTELGGQYQRLVEAFAAALSSRDTEVREVLEGLIRWSVCLEYGGTTTLHWCDPEGTCGEDCLRTQVLWSRLQPKEPSDVTE